MEFISRNFVPLLFAGLLLFLFTGFPTLVTDSLNKTAALNMETMKIEAETGNYGNPQACSASLGSRCEGT
jgi:hypothetical protein